MSKYERIYPRMVAAGYLFSEDGEAKTPSSKPNATIWDERLLANIEGRLENLQYMSHAMDMFDITESREHENTQGTRQFQHLLEKSTWVALVYVVMRRHQRNYNKEGLRAVMAILLSCEKGIASEKDALNIIGSDLLEREVAKRQVRRDEKAGSWICVG